MAQFPSLTSYMSENVPRKGISRLMKNMKNILVAASPFAFIFGLKYIGLKYIEYIGLKYIEYIGWCIFAALGVFLMRAAYLVSRSVWRDRKQLSQSLPSLLWKLALGVTIVVLILTGRYLFMLICVLVWAGYLVWKNYPHLFAALCVAFLLLLIVVVTGLPVLAALTIFVVVEGMIMSGIL